MVAYADHAVPVTQESVEAAVEWLWSLDRLASVSRTATCEAVLKALQDKNVGGNFIIILYCCIAILKTEFVLL